MLDHRTRPRDRRNGRPPPFRRIVCALEPSSAAVEQTLALAGPGGHVVFVAPWGTSAEHAIERAHAAGVEAGVEYATARLGDVLLSRARRHDLVVVGAHSHARLTGIMLSDAATLLVHRSPSPVLIARERPLARGVLVATRAVPADRPAVETAARIAVHLDAHLTVLHVAAKGERRDELAAELAGARALLGRPLDPVEAGGAPASAIVQTADGDGAGLVVVGSGARLGLGALRSVSERVAHLAPCSVLVLRSAERPRRPSRRAPRSSAPRTSPGPRARPAARSRPGRPPARSAAR
ncbi:MAG TPA: universal stress protein [Solirubrobacter sp.]|nr:universal stress protein [Solirubrobacter sp.]